MRESAHCHNSPREDILLFISRKKLEGSNSECTSRWPVAVGQQSPESPAHLKMEEKQPEGETSVRWRIRALWGTLINGKTEANSISRNQAGFCEDGTSPFADAPE